MPRAYVGDDGDRRFSAAVDCDEDGPFSFVLGPTGVGPEEAITWARRRAERVTVRVGSDFYTAGLEAVRDLPSWPGHGDDRELPSESAADFSDWQVEGRTGWFRDDASDAARAIARRLDDDARARDVAHGVTKTGFHVMFAIRAASIVRRVSSRRSSCGRRGRPRRSTRCPATTTTCRRSPSRRQRVKLRSAGKPLSRDLDEGWVRVAVRSPPARTHAFHAKARAVLTIGQ
jgi:hypothetical protein